MAEDIEKAKEAALLKASKYIAGCLTVSNFRSSHREVFCEKGVHKFLVKILEKYLWRSSFLVKLQALKPVT